MRRIVLPTLVVLLLGATSFGVVQFNEARRLRAELAGMGKDRDDLRRKLWEQRKHEATLATGAGGESSRAAGQAEEAQGAAEPVVAVAGPPERMRPEGGRFNAIMNSPEVQQLLAIQQKAGLDSRYAALFKRLNLSPADLEKFKNLLVEKQAVVMDTMAAARSQGMLGRDNRDEIRQLVQDAQAEVDASIRTSLGESVYAQYKSYETTLPERSLVDQLGQRLSYSTTPLTDTQADQLVQILAATDAGTNGASARGRIAMGFVASLPAGASGAMLGGGTRITNEAVAQAQGVLAPQQLSALQSLRQEQQAAAKLMEQMRANRQNPERANRASPAAPGGG